MISKGLASSAMESPAPMIVPAATSEFSSLSGNKITGRFFDSFSRGEFRVSSFDGEVDASLLIDFFHNNGDFIADYKRARRACDAIGSDFRNMHQPLGV